MESKFEAEVAFVKMIEPLLCSDVIGPNLSLQWHISSGPGVCIRGFESLRSQCEIIQILRNQRQCLGAHHPTAADLFSLHPSKHADNRDATTLAEGKSKS